jgi:hypothetical protein
VNGKKIGNYSRISCKGHSVTDFCLDPVGGELIVSMNKIKFFLQRVYRLTISFNKQEEIVWRELKKLQSDADWKHGVYEKEKYIETVFEISKEKGALFYYMIYDGSFHCRVKILQDYPTDFTTDLFILSAHFNNLLTNGVVVVDVNNCFVEYHLKRDLLIPLLYSGEIYDQLIRHHRTSKDIYAAFQRLIIEQEAPAIIIADLLKQKDAKRNDEN